MVKKEILKMQFSEIGIIRQSIRTATRQGFISKETEQECEKLIEKLQKINEVFNLVEDRRYFWTEEIEYNI